MKKEIKTVVVLGMHRSGTSMTSAILEKLGINMGEETLGAVETNPIGHFEDKIFLDLNKRILNDAGGSWDNPPNYKTILDLKDKYKDEIEKLVSNKKENWGWKEPRTSLTINLYYPYLKNIYFIYCKRNEDDVAKSLKKRNDMSLEKGKELKKIYDSRIDDFLCKINTDRKKIVKYEKVLSNPESEIQKIINFLDLEVNKQQYKEAVNIVLPKDELDKIVKKRKIINKLNLIKKGFKEPYKIPGYILRKIKGDK
jgi:hypothetical protein